MCNLADEHGRVLSLVSPRAQVGPFSLVLAGNGKLQPDRGATIRVDPRAQRLYCGAVAVDYGAARCWQPCPDWPALRRATPDPRDVHELPVEIAALLEALLDGVCAANLAQVRTAARRLAGRGMGLTPTGDDVLVGVLYGLWVWRPERELLQAIAGSAAPHTTTLSAAFLRAAAAGEATCPWLRLAGGDAGALADILATGHSSGREAWTAYAATWTRLARERR